MSKGTLAVGIVAWVLGGLYAGYLSWKCNSNHGFGVMAKVVFGILSFFGSWSYCLTYLFYKSWTCDPMASVRAMHPGQYGSVL